VTVALRTCLVNGRLFTVMVTCPKARENPEQLKQFLESFRPLDKKVTKPDENKPGTPPDPKDPRGPIKAVAQDDASQKKSRDQLQAWLQANLTLSPETGALDKMLSQFDSGVKQGKGFELTLGSGLVKSGKPALVAGRNGSFHVFELTPAQVKDRVDERSTNFGTTSVSKELLDPTFPAEL
jgi:hypothetical protein